MIRCWLFLIFVSIIKTLSASQHQFIVKRLVMDCSQILFSFISYSYKADIDNTLVHRTYKVNSALGTFNDNVKDLCCILKKNQYPESLINRVVKSNVDNVHSSNNSTSPTTDTSTIYFKLPFLKLSNFTQQMVRMIVKSIIKILKSK